MQEQQERQGLREQWWVQEQWVQEQWVQGQWWVQEQRE